MFGWHGSVDVVLSRDRCNSENGDCRGVGALSDTDEDNSCGSWVLE